MYSGFVQNAITAVELYGSVSVHHSQLLHECMAAYLGVLGHALDAQVSPDYDLMQLTVRLLLLDEAVADMDGNEPSAEYLHYLLGMGFEQSGVLLARFSEGVRTNRSFPLPWEHDLWYRLTLSMLHYMAGGYRVQALTVLGHLDRWTQSIPEDQIAQYRNAFQVLRALYDSQEAELRNTFAAHLSLPEILLGQSYIETPSLLRLRRLALKTVGRRLGFLDELGQNNVSDWLSTRGISHSGSIGFWTEYLEGLRRRGITSFTREQVGDGFDTWLRIDTNLVIVLPTGSGKSVIGELLTALTLASGKQVIWLVPTRALVRQVHRELWTALPLSRVGVEELPTTEDFIPQFRDALTERGSVTVTTPEKLDALLRVNRSAVADVGLVVFDEAQLLLKDARSTIAESVLRQLQTIADTRFALMSAFPECLDALSSLVQRLGGDNQPFRLVSSESRPTRRMYGTLTAASLNERFVPELLLFPPDPQAESAITTNPYRMTLAKVRVSESNRKPIDVARLLVERTNQVNVRAVVFVQNRTSANAQALKIAAGRAQKLRTRGLPGRDIDRLRLELGRNSVIEQTSPYGVAPHHAGLTQLEQHFVERWTRRGVISTVIATPTLAQGVNLPFDISVVTFVKRNKTEAGKNSQEPVPISEIKNMLGRAGRAGQVTDGICIISDLTKARRDPTRILDDKRRFFFSETVERQEEIGLRRLLHRAVNARVDRPEWPFELLGLDFAESQTLVVLALKWTETTEDPVMAVHSRLGEYPSTQLLPEVQRVVIAQAVSQLALRIRELSKEDDALAAALIRTGLPIEVLAVFLEQLRASSDLLFLAPDEKLLKMDEFVRQALQITSEREWNRRLRDDKPHVMEAYIQCAQQWRSGVPIAAIERTWLNATQGRTRNVSDAVGNFLNHKISQLAQFWGAIGVCWEIISTNGEYQVLDSTITQAQSYVREGVSNTLQLEWLRQIGHLDRVLAHDLEAVSIVSREDTGAMRRYVHDQINQWKTNQNSIPVSLSELPRNALIGVLDQLPRRI